MTKPVAPANGFHLYVKLLEASAIYGKTVNFSLLAISLSKGAFGQDNYKKVIDTRKLLGYNHGDGLAVLHVLFFRFLWKRK